MSVNTSSVPSEKTELSEHGLKDPVLQPQPIIRTVCDNHKELICFMALMVFITLMLRLMSLGLYPLMDTTEARYGEMARIMFETGNWITPMFDYEVPFWGKPPLFSWMSAAGFEVFGVNEFAARVPHFMTGVIIIALTGWFAGRKMSQTACSANKVSAFSESEQADQKKKVGLEQNWLAAMLLTTTCAFLLMSGAVMTDTALTLGVTLSMIGFWQAWHSGSKAWGYLFFVGLAIGVLAKGPLTLVLVGISLTLWLVPDNRWMSIHKRLPWIGGTVLFLTLSLPWYLIAESQTPGFLNYFIVGEHFKRFVISGWQGDLYGSAHNEVRGTIWLYWLMVSLPWGPLLLWQLYRYLKKRPVLAEGKPQGYTGFLWCWMLSPMMLFTFAGNILPSYVLPGIPAMALLIAEYHRRQALPTMIFSAGLLAPVIVVAVVWGLNSGVSSKEAEKKLLDQWMRQPEAVNSELIYLRKRPFSAQFYSRGKAVQAPLPLSKVLQQLEKPAFIVLEKKKIAQSVEALNRFCQSRGDARKRRLYFCQPDS